VTAADEGTPIAVDVVAGNRHDAPLLKPMLDKTAGRVGDIDQVVGDKAFDGRPQRAACRAHGADPVIPPKRNRLDPEPLDVAAYRERNRVERLVGRLKQCRRVATRYEKRAVHFLAMVTIAAILLWL
jgi:transposase